MKALIIDDEPRARNLIKNIVLENYDDKFKVLESGSLEDGVELIKKEVPAIIFLDIKLPGKSGLTINEFFSNSNPSFQIIFTTAYNEYAIQAFKTNAIDFLLKPIDPKELIEATEKAIKRSEQNTVDDRLEKVEKALRTLTIDKIALEVPKGYFFVTPDDIILFEADGMYTTVHLKNKRKELICKPLRHFADQLQDNELFYKPHRSYLINLNYIKEVKKTDGYYIILENDKIVPVPRESRKAFQHIIDSLF